MRIALLLDDRPGNSTQTHGIAAALQNSTSGTISEHRITYNRWVRLPNRLRLALHVWGAELPTLDAADIIIATGRRLAPLLVTLGKQTNARTIQIMQPELPYHLFSRVLLPQHDNPPVDARIIPTLGAPHAMNARRIAQAAAQMSLPANPYSVFLVGGDSKHGSLPPSLLAEHIHSLRQKLGQEHGLYVVTSRRTTPAQWQALQTALAGTPHTLYRYPDTPNPYPGILARATRVIATIDSVAMLCEAASSGTPLYMADAERAASTKHHALARALIAGNYARPLSTLTLPDTPTQQLDEATRVATCILQ